MAEEKQRRIDAAVALDDESMMEETDIVSSVNVGGQNGETCEVSSDQGQESDQREDDQETEEEPAAWAGRVPLSQTLSLWRGSREKERFVTFFIQNCVCFDNY